MKRSLRRVLLLASAACLASAGAALVPTAPATAEDLCATVTVYVSGSGTPVGSCMTVVDQWGAPCAGSTNTVGGTGAGVVVCIPTPV